MDTISTQHPPHSPDMAVAVLSEIVELRMDMRNCNTKYTLAQGKLSELSNLAFCRSENYKLKYTTKKIKHKSEAVIKVNYIGDFMQVL